MSLWAIIPIKPLKRGKSRLSGVLSDQERSSLNINLLINTLRTLDEVRDIDRMLVISRDLDVLEIASDFGAFPVYEQDGPELNTALHRATEAACTYGVQSVLILPADLPLITPYDIQAFIEYGGEPPEIVIASDRRGDGTNALLVNPAGLIDYSYGPGSYNRHVQQARALGACVVTCHMPSLQLDLDLPEDLNLWREARNL